MRGNIRIILCLMLALFAAVSLAAVLGSLGALPVGAMGESYLLRDVDGRIAVFCPADAQEPDIITDIRVRDLPTADRVALIAGVSASDYETAMRLLEDYGG